MLDPIMLRPFAWALTCFCSRYDFSAVQVLLLEAQEAFRFGYFGWCR